MKRNKGKGCGQKGKEDRGWEKGKKCGEKGRRKEG